MSISTRAELLSPAGSRECLEAAVANGADAVYLGTREFNARLPARNFTREELGRAVRYCHRKGVRVYLTMNTLVKNHELGRFFSTLSQAYSAGIDGVIIQHLSLLEPVKRGFPGLAVFLSTQTAIGNADTASLLKPADRIILPRELSLEEVKRITATGALVEVFVHGALCFSYSGLCLFSSLVDNRSGNRGSCAQLCRQRYNGSYPLSTRELCLVRRIPELMEAGISGFKIEGRMRSPLYVAVATRLYRKAIDSCLAGDFKVPRKELAEMEVVFHRGFTEGFLGGDRNIVSPEKPMNRGAFLGVVQKGEVVLTRPAAVGDGVGIWGEGGVTGGVIPRMVKNGREVASAGTGEKVSLGLPAPEGSRIYLTSSASIRIAPDFVIHRTPIPTPRRGKTEVALPKVTPQKAPVLQLLVKAYSLAEASEAAEAGADMVFYNILYPDFPERDAGAYVPRLLSDEELARALDLLRQKRPMAILTGNLGLLAHRNEFKVPLFLDYSLNAFNDLDIHFFQKYRAIPVLSPELSLKELAEMKNKDVVILAHGDLVLVNTRIPMAEQKLTNDKGADFPVRKESGYWQVLNSRPFGLFDEIRPLYELGFRQFLIDQAGKGAEFVALYRRLLKEDLSARRLRKGYTSGHLHRPVD